MYKIQYSGFLGGCGWVFMGWGGGLTPLDPAVANSGPSFRCILTIHACLPIDFIFSAISGFGVAASS